MPDNMSKDSANVREYNFEEKFRCPVCGKFDFESVNDHDICPECGWENDVIQFEDPDYDGGANHMSLNEARAMYAEYCRKMEEATISRIVIKGTNAFPRTCYNDKITIDENSISYEYKPRDATKDNPVQKWSYKTTSPIFQKLFMRVCKAVEEVISWNIISRCCDAGVTTFEVTYADKRKVKRVFITQRENFKKCFAVIKQMVPACERVPAVLFTQIDYKKKHKSSSMGY